MKGKAITVLNPIKLSKHLSARLRTSKKFVITIMKDDTIKSKNLLKIDSRMIIQIVNIPK